MRHGCIVLLLSLLASRAAFAECTADVLGIGGSDSPSEVSSDERRELEQLLGTPLDDAACGKMHRLGGSGFIVKRGFFVLTMDEALFVSDRKVKEVLFRTHYRPGQHVPPRAWLGGRSHVVRRHHDGRRAVSVRLGCDVVGRRVADELSRRIPAPADVSVSADVPLGGPQYSCD